MRQRLLHLGTAVLIAGVLGCAAGSLDTKSDRFGVPAITKEDLRPRLGAPHMVVVDVRLLEQWEASRNKVTGAVWEEAEEVNSWANKYAKTDDIVLYCA